MIKKINWIIVYICLLVLPVIVLAAEWQDPPSGSVPPENNIDRPITVGTRADHKLGPITTNSYFATEANSAMSTILQGQSICFRDNSTGNFYNCTNTDENNIQGSVSLKADNTANLLKLFSSSGKVAISGVSEVNFDLANPELQLVYGVSGVEKHWSWYVDSTGTNPTGQLRLWGGAGLANQLVVSQAGDIGLGGNLNPAYKLDVIGRVNATGGLCINGDCKASWNDITGMWHTGTDNSIVNNDSRRVGVNTEDPLSTLEVNGVISTTPYGGYFRANPFSEQDLYGYISSAGQVKGSGLKLETTDGPETTDGKTRLRLENDGSIGQNTDGSPATTLEIQSDSYDPTQVRISDFVTNPELQLQYGTSDTDHWAMYVSNPSETNNGDSSLYFWNPVANANVLSIDLTGNVGVKNDLTVYNNANIGNEAYIGDRGNTAPINSLTVAQSLAVSVTGSTDSTGQISIARGDGWYSDIATAGDMVMRSSNYDLILTARNSSGAIRFGTGATDTEKMTIASNGNVGIGDSSPSYALDVKSLTTSPTTVQIQDATNNPELRLAYGSGTNHWAVYVDQTADDLRFWNQNGNAMAILQNGNVGIGTLVPSVKLEVAGDILTTTRVTAPEICLNADCKTAWPVASAPYGTTGWVQYNNNGVFGASNNFTWVNNKLNVGSIVLDSALSKLTVGTIDPVYKIGNQKYATFMAGMTGVKEETTAVLKLEYKPDLGYFANELSFAKEGTDLWLFAQAANLAQEGLDNVVVILSPDFSGQVWYEKQVQSNKIMVYAKPDQEIRLAEVSYRLTAPRFDYKKWPNKIKTSEVGFDLDKLIVK